MTCAICRYFDECLARNTTEACTHDDPHGMKDIIILRRKNNSV